MEREIYLDHNASTPLAPEVLEEMLPFLRETFGNPSSVHAHGIAARAGLDAARDRLAGLLGAAPGEIIFTSGGTESDNLAVLGICRAAPPGRRHVVTTAVEHAAVERPLQRLEREGWRVTRVPVEGDGRVEARRVIEAMDPTGTALVTVMHAQNETGALMPVAEIAAAARRMGIPVHTDAAQSVGKLPVDVDSLSVDLLTVAGHKFYGPKGVGALYVRRGTDLEPVALGAGHEGGRRAGTENVAGIVGLGAAAELAAKELPGRTQRLQEMRDRLQQQLRRRLGEVVLNGPEEGRLPNTLNISLPGIETYRLLPHLRGVATAAGAACHAGGAEPSAVLLAMGLGRERALASLRLTVGRDTTAADVDEAAERIAAAVRSLAAAS